MGWMGREQVRLLLESGGLGLLLGVLFDVCCALSRACGGRRWLRFGVDAAFGVPAALLTFYGGAGDHGRADASAAVRRTGGGLLAPAPHGWAVGQPLAVSGGTDARARDPGAGGWRGCRLRLSGALDLCRTAPKTPLRSGRRRAILCGK